KGYSCRDSDIEFWINLLRGPHEIEDDDSRKLTDKAVRLIEREGFIGEAMMGSISGVYSLADAIDDLRISVPRDAQDRQHFFADDLIWLFLFVPVAYADSLLLETVRRRLLSVLKEYDLGDEAWPEISRAYSRFIQIKFEEPFMYDYKPHLRHWLKRL